MAAENNSLNLNVPEQTLVSLSFCDPTPTGVENWIAQLPMANIGETARQLYHAIIELNQLEVSPAVRIQLLEAIRAPIYYVCTGLSRHFLNQSIVLPEKQLKIANLAQALQVHLATGYKIIIQEGESLLKPEKNRKLLACACHRVISDFGRIILRSCQLYCASPNNIWKEIHQIFLFAEEHNLLKYQVQDSQNHEKNETTIAESYKRILLLGCCRPNQLRQNDLAAIYNAFETWADYVEVGKEYSSSAIFVINMQQDAPPHYRNLSEDSLMDHYYGFDTAEIVSRLTHYLISLQKKNAGQPAQIDVPASISEQVALHLNQALGILTKRTFKRIASNGKLNLCAGLSAVHYYCSGQVEFHTQMLSEMAQGPGPDDDNIFLTRARNRNDAWSAAFDAGGGGSATHASVPINFNRPITEDGECAYPQYVVPLINTSPGGYCLHWKGDVPSNIQAGELLSVREDDSAEWSLAAIRWIRQSKQRGTQIGIELLAPSAQPCGIQLTHKTGAPSEFLRGLILPELKAIGKKATVLTPRLPFQTGSRVIINCKGMESKCRLTKRVSATGSFSQFEFEDYSSIGETRDSDTNSKDDREDEFDSLWPSL